MSSNLIIQFLDGNGDSIIVAGTNNLKGKASIAADCPLVEVPIGLRGKPDSKFDQLEAALAKSDEGTRIYLRGHGNYKVKALGGWSPDTVASILKSNGLKKAKVISVTGCNAARGDYANNEPERITNWEFQDRKALADKQLGVTLTSFAGLFHKALGEAPGPVKNIPITARMYSVNVEKSGKKTLGVGEVGREVKSGTGSARWSKVLYTWKGNAQHAEWLMPGHGKY
jgi:hypothetical protein